MPADAVRGFRDAWKILQGIDRHLLAIFLHSFADEFAATNIPLPLVSLPDQEYRQAGLALLSRPDLPPRFIEALSSITELAAPEGQSRIQNTLARLGFNFGLPEHPSSAEAAVHAWLCLPALLAQAELMGSSRGTDVHLMSQSFTGRGHTTAANRSQNQNNC